MSTERFRSIHGVVIAIQYDGRRESIQRLRELLPNVEVNAPIGVGDMLQLDGGELLKCGVYVAKASNGKFRVFEPEVFEDIYEREQRDSEAAAGAPILVTPG